MRKLEQQSSRNTFLMSHLEVMPSSVQLRQSSLLVLATGSRGTAVIPNPTECLELMKKWEEATLPALGTAGL